MEPLRFYIPVHVNRGICQNSIHVTQKKAHLLQTLQSVGRQFVHCTTFFMANSVESNFGISRGGIILGPALNALPGPGSAAKKNPPQPAATAAFANTGANSLCPLDRS